MNEEGVVSPGRGIGHRSCGRMGKLAVHSGNKGFEGITTNEFARQRLRLFFSFCLKEMLFCRGSGTVLRPDDIKTDFDLPADRQGRALAKLVQVVFFNPVLVNRIFDPKHQSTPLIAQWDNRGEPAMESIGSNYFFEFATDFDPDFRRIVHSFLNSFYWLRGEIIRFKKKRRKRNLFFL